MFKNRPVITISYRMQNVLARLATAAIIAFPIAGIAAIIVALETSYAQDAADLSAACEPYLDTPLERASGRVLLTVDGELVEGDVSRADERLYVTVNGDVLCATGPR